MSAGMLAASQASYGRYAAIIIDADSGKVLHEVDATQSWYPASLTKVMTLYMTFEALKKGQIQFFDAMRASSHAARQPTSKLGLRAGEYLTVRDAILAIITRSANDAAVVLAEHLGGSEENFAVKMTNKARELGMYNTRFLNATGLPNDWQVSTSRDMAVLAWSIKRHFPDYYQNFSAHGFNYKGRELRGINKFVLKYPGAEGMKTGFTCGSGYNLIASAQQNGKRLIGVVLGGMTSAERYQLMYQLMDAGFENRYGDGSGHHITSMPNTLTGPPPYQLGCGSHAYLHTASAGHHSPSRHRYLHAGKKYAKRVRYSKHKRHMIAAKTHHLTRKSRLSRHAIAIKRAQASRPTKLSKASRVAHSKKASRQRVAAKYKLASRTNKNKKNRYRHS